jgi:hypothetical protein
MPSDGKSSHCLWQGELIKEFIQITTYEHCKQINKNKYYSLLFYVLRDFTGNRM